MNSSNPYLDIFGAALNLPAPWMVTNVELKPSGPQGSKELHINVDFARGTKFPCPCDGCGKSCSVHDTVERDWRHINFFQYHCYIHARVPRIDCGDHGVKQVSVPWARPGSGFTLLFEGLMLMLSADMSMSGVARQLEEHDTKLWRATKYWVDLARSKQDLSDVQNVGIDETSRKGHDYITIVADLDKKSVIHVTTGKDAATVDSFVKLLEEKGGSAEKIAVATSDMSLAFRKGIREKFPNATHVIDKFHVVKLFNEAVDAVRRKEVRDEPLLKRTKYVWLKNFENLTPKQRDKYIALPKKRLKTGRAYAMRCALQEIYNASTKEEAQILFRNLFGWMRRSQIEEMKDLALTLKGFEKAIFAYWDHRHTNALLEGLNSVIQLIKTRARGFRNMQYFSTMIFLTCGKLGLERLCSYP